MNLLQKASGGREIHIRHAATYAGVSRAQIVRAIDAGKLRVIRLGGDDFVSRADLDNLLAEGAFLSPPRS